MNQITEEAYKITFDTPFEAKFEISQEVKKALGPNCPSTIELFNEWLKDNLMRYMIHTHLGWFPIINAQHLYNLFMDNVAKEPYLAH